MKFTPQRLFLAFRQRGRNSIGRRLGLFLICTACGLLLTGCFGILKPAQSNARHYVLTPRAVSEPEKTNSHSVALGIGPVKLPAYLFNSMLAVRRGTNEVEYLSSAIWAERLNTGFQRVLAANLAADLGTDSVHLQAWHSDEVRAEIYVSIEQFDVDTDGRAVLATRWRILSPRGETLLKAGSSRNTAQGPPPGVSASGAIATMSDLVAEFSGQLAKAIQQSIVSPGKH